MIEFVASNPALFIAIVFVISLMVGSFLNVVIYRLPVMLERDWRGQCQELLDLESPADSGEKFNLITPPSHCPSCQSRIRAWQNIPLLSYLILGGKCGACGNRISVRYPVVELATAIVSAVTAVRFGFSLETLAALGLTWSLIVLTVVDIDRQLLPDNITLPLLWLGLLLSLFTSPDGSPLFVDPRSSLIGAAAGYVSLWLVYQLFRLLTKKEGMGYGDFKLAAALGAWLGWQMLPLVVVLSAFVGATVGILMIVFAGRARAQPMPFGPFLAGAAWIALIWGDVILDRYLRVFGLA